MMFLRLMAVALSLALAGQVSAHDWFTDKNNLEGLGRCCGGNDCAEVPMEMIESGAVQPTATGFAVDLSVAQAQHFNKQQSKPVHQDIPSSMVQPSESHDPNGSGYALCIYPVDVIRCFFAPQNAMLMRQTKHMVARL
jgi:hypothetical protein